MKFLPRNHEGLYDPRTHVPRPVVGLDIDGTMGDYHGHFHRFAEGYVGRTLPEPRFYRGDRSFYEYLGMSKTLYRQVKLAYRQGGLKRSMPAYEGVSEMSRSLRKAGAVVVICTTRPYLQLDNIEPDTRHWLRRNGIQCDGMISGEHKYRDLLRTYGSNRIVSVFEDLPEQARLCTKLGLPLFLRDQSYNRPPVLNGHEWDGYRVGDAEEFCAEALVLLEVWKEKWLCA